MNKIEYDDTRYRRWIRKFHPNFIDELLCSSEVDWKKVVEAMNIRLNYPVWMYSRLDNRKKIVQKQWVWNGHNYVICPFHTEQTPSCHIDFRRWYFYCFWCHQKWTMLRFVKQCKNLDVNSAIDFISKISWVHIKKKFTQTYRDVSTEISEEDFNRQTDEYREYCKRNIEEITS